uniref:Uncharacterized protein n=1 Tax=Siphoviridae sp. ct0D87 TaxID=2827760 RepID=A0A8S5SB51_9CAUD|nr:MAG TPA: hypothetical protein [Siphoviridae sp. ct0D87]
MLVASSFLTAISCTSFSTSYTRKRIKKRHNS